jgi:hypothetical protein
MHTMDVHKQMYAFPHNLPGTAPRLATSLQMGSDQTCRSVTLERTQADVKSVWQAIGSALLLRTEDQTTQSGPRVIKVRSLGLKQLP